MFVWSKDFGVFIKYISCDSLYHTISLYVTKLMAHKFCKLDFEHLCNELDFEVYGIFSKELKLVIFVMYRSPDGSVEVFLEKIDDLLIFFAEPKWKNYDIVIGGDVNSHFDMNKDQQSSNHLKNILGQFNFNYTNSKPARGLGILDNIFTNIESSLLVL